MAVVLTPSRKAGRTKARRTRERHGLGFAGPVPCLLELVEGCGVPVGIVEDLGDGLAGVYLARNGDPLILLNGSDAAPRLRFTLAHELCHHLFEDQQHVDTHKGMYEHDFWEVRANAFAAELLMPTEAVLAWAEEAEPVPVTLEHVVDLAGRFGTSAQAALIHLETCGILDDRRRFERLWDEIVEGEQHWLAGAGYEDSISAAKRCLPRLPRRRSVLDQAARGDMPVEQAALQLGQAPAELVATLDAFGLGPPKA